jgi:hypothetical protein
VALALSSTCSWVVKMVLACRICSAVHSGCAASWASSRDAADMSAPTPAVAGSSAAARRASIWANTSSQAVYTSRKEVSLARPPSGWNTVVEK